jgi:putative oxidoreductase
MSDDRGYLTAIARVCLAIVFIVFGFIQFTNIGNYISHATVIKVSGYTGGLLTPTIIAYLVAAIDLFGGLAILVGFQTRLASIVLTVFVLLTMFLAHDFWNMAGPPRAANQANFYKNLAIIGGFVLLFVQGPGPLSLDAWLRRRR